MAYQGQVLDNLISGERIVFRKTAADTKGELLAFDLELAPHGHVPGIHVHPVQEERFEVVSGTMTFRRGLKKIVAHEGDTVVVPPGTAHKFTNGSAGSARVRVEVRPALKMEWLLETAVDLAQEGRTTRTGMPKALDLALFMLTFDREVRAPFVPAALMRAVMAPLAWLAARRGLGARYSAVEAAGRGGRREAASHGAAVTAGSGAAERPGPGRPPGARPRPGRPSPSRPSEGHVTPSKGSRLR